jgi:hypothetical protein
MNELSALKEGMANQAAATEVVQNPLVPKECYG